MTDDMSKREQFGSSLGILAATAGSAIGLGNIWRFPYITGKYGGAAFLIIYLVSIAAVGLPVMLSEFIIGRKARKNAVASFRTLSPGRPWFVVGWMGLISAFMILSFYGVVGGWTLNYIFKSMFNSFADKTPDQIGAIFGTFISSPLNPVFWQLVFMALTAWIVYSGVKRGIERSSKILMPLLLIIILILDIRSLTLPGAMAGMAFMFKPDFSRISGEVLLAAMGHGFFSLSLGMGAMLTYGSYISGGENLAGTAVKVTVADTLVALLAGIAIFPAVFAFSIEPSAGPGLVFITLPAVFQKIPGGFIFSALFFLLLALAALTSAISILEVVVAYAVEDLRITRKTATIVSAAAITLLGVPCSLANGPIKGFTIMGKNFFDLMDFTSANLLLPLGGFLIVIFVCWFRKRSEIRKEASSNGTLPIGYFPIFRFAGRFLTPLAIALVFLNGLGLI